MLSVGLSLMVGCGGGNNNGGGSLITVTVSPATVALSPSAVQQFTATVSGTSNTAVTWEVNGTTGGDSAVGTIDSSGKYTAPATPPSPDSVTVAAVSQADSSVSGSATVTIPVNNTASISVDLGPAGNYANGVFTTVTICVPGTTSCQDIDNVLVDTGSYGLRVLENGTSPLSLTLPRSTDNTSNPLYECIQFADTSYVWGPVATADIQMAGEKASALPIQIISANPAFAAPASCSSGGGPNDNTVQMLGANGILGVGPFLQDCGTACAPSSTSVPSVYYLCPSSGCAVASVPTSGQLANPVGFFPQDNNGVLISLPSISPDGQATAAGSMIFGIGTKSNNSLGSATLYTADNCGNVSTTYNGTTYQDSSTSCSGGTYFDTGSNGLFFLDATTLASTGIVECSDFSGYYCPAQTVNFTVTNQGSNGASGQVTFSIANADTLLTSNGGLNAAFNDLGGDSSGSFDFGLPFFFGRNVFIGIEGQNSPTGVAGPYYAY